ncbi:hypothetical protein ACGFMM_25960 [Streptomyces sp. NPDC048604]|uniref:hypothetical protein n=1 Tax=Streptomyces sp. NPDC048604 TaxID=3365578 RepID=UPI003724860B
MCVYAEAPYKLHYACVTCRVSFKRHPPEPGATHPCPNCSRPLACAGHDFAAPPRRDARAWSVVAAVLAEGLRYEGRSTCGCTREPRPRPRTPAQLRSARTAAERAGVPLAELLDAEQRHA